MSSRFYISYTAIILVLGFTGGFFYSEKQKMDSLLQPNIVGTVDTKKNAGNASKVIKLEETPHQADDDYTEYTKKNNQSLSTKDYSIDQAKTLIDDMPDYILHQYIDKFMAKGTSDIIQDKRKFAARAIEELYNQNNNTPLSGDITLSFSHEMPDVNIDTSRIPKEAKLYAHLNTYGHVPASPYVFVKWVDNSTGQILLFEKKDILATRQTNWVNMQPHDGWKVGSYDIKFYQFNDALEPIAQLTYHIYEVIE